MADDIAIKVESVSKSFKLPHDKQNSIKGGLISLVKGGKRTYETQEVLKDISFEIKKGEFFGIVGRNGSGKSTLLKMLAGIYTPTSGNIQVKGTLTPFIELGVGFNHELTGRENVFLNGSLLGFNREEMAAMYDDIVEFAELENFMDQKLKNYSSGMQVRLAFSIAIKAQGDILLLDEVLAVGDAAFQRKCFDYFDQLKAENKTVILVTHSMDSVKKYCSEAILVDNSHRVAANGVDEVIEKYMEILSPAKDKQLDRPTFDGLELLDSAVDVGLNQIKISFKYRIKENASKIDTYGAFSIKDRVGNVVIAYNGTIRNSKEKLQQKTTYDITWSFQNVLANGVYKINLAAVDVKGNIIGRFEDALTFKIRNKSINLSSVDPEIRMVQK